MLQMCCIRFGVAKFYFVPQIVNWHDLGTPPGIVKSDTCRADQHRDPTPKHIEISATNSLWRDTPILEALLARTQP